MLTVFQTSKAKKLGFFTHHDHGEGKGDGNKSEEFEEDSDSELGQIQ